MTSITQEARRQANLKLLQRTCDAHIADLLQSATHVVLYEFPQHEKQWVKCGVEGSCFLVASTRTAVQLIILNRHSANNFVLTVVPALQVQEQDPFLILQEMPPAGNRTLGLWFHSADERVALTKQLQTTVAQLANQTFVFPTAAATPASAPPLRPPPAPPAAAAAAAAAVTEVTQDERDHLAALLSQTAMAAGRSHSAPKPAPPNSNTNTTPPPNMPGGSVALDKKALQLTLLSLIQDERFLDLLHSQYLRVVHARAKKTNDTNNPNSNNNNNSST